MRGVLLQLHTDIDTLTYTRTDRHIDRHRETPIHKLTPDRQTDTYTHTHAKAQKTHTRTHTHTHKRIHTHTHTYTHT